MFAKDGGGGWLDQPPAREEAFNTSEETPDSQGKTRSTIPKYALYSPTYALLENPEKPVPTRDAEGKKTCRGEYLVELHRCSPHILWLHWGQSRRFPRKN